MAEVIRMPRMSDTMEEGNIIGWLKKEGEEVEAGETLAEVETDKATMELDSFVDGTLLHIAVKEGPVPIDGVIAVIGDEGEDWKKVLKEAEAAGNGDGGGEESGAEEEQAPSPMEQFTGGGSSDSGKEKEEAETEPTVDDKRVKASPLARSMAKDVGIDLANVQGSGDGGRIVKRDIEEQIEKQQSAPAAAPAPQPAAPAEKPAEKPREEGPKVPAFVGGGGEANYEEKPISQMRKTIARRLSESKFTAPHFYLTLEINMDKAVQIRERLKEVAPTKISFNDLVIKAAAAALRQHPAINASWLAEDNKIRYNKDINIGVAVAVDEGLLVPVIRYADMKTLSQINVEVKEYAGRAKQRKLQPEEMQGNTFTVSNLGMFGIEEFTGIINPPDSCILAVGGIIEKPIVKNGEIVIGNMMKVTLSCDHRVVDGATGAAFLQTVKTILEDPIRLMV